LFLFAGLLWTRGVEKWKTKGVEKWKSRGSRLENFSPEIGSETNLQKKIQTKDEVLAELMAEHVALKEDIGEH